MQCSLSSQATSFSATSFREGFRCRHDKLSCHATCQSMGTGPWKAQDSSANQSQLSFGLIWTDSHVLCCCFWKAISWHVRYSKLGYLNLVSTLDTCILHTQTGAWLATMFSVQNQHIDNMSRTRNSAEFGYAVFGRDLKDSDHNGST